MTRPDPGMEHTLTEAPFRSVASNRYPAVSASVKRNVYIFSDVWTQVNGVVSLYRALFDAVEEGDYPVRLIWIYPNTETSIVQSGDVTLAGHRPLFMAGIPKYPEIRTGLPRPAFLASLVEAHGEPSIVHVASQGLFGEAGRRMANRFDVPLSGFYHTFLPAYLQSYFGSTFGNALGLGRFWRRLGWRVGTGLDRHILGRSDVLFCHTPMIRDHLAKHYPETPKVLASEFLDTRRYPVTRCTKVNASAGPLQIGYVGRLAVEKSVERILEASRCNRVRMHVVGDGPLFAGLTKRYPDAIYHGYQDSHALRSLYSRFDFLVLPSATDTLGLVSTLR